jgi:hypothetical protein
MIHVPREPRRSAAELLAKRVDLLVAPHGFDELSQRVDAWGENKRHSGGFARKPNIVIDFCNVERALRVRPPENPQVLGSAPGS